MTSAELLQAFGRFWAAYPARPENPKAAAREVFMRRVREGADPYVIVAAAGRYAEFTRTARKDAHLIPHARTWLSQRRWEDWPPVSETPAPAWTPGDHPLAWMCAEIGEGAWRSWIEPLRVVDGDPVMIIAPRRLTADRVRAQWSGLIGERLGAFVITVVEGALRG
jgi:hypothetical protein